MGRLILHCSIDIACTSLDTDINNRTGLRQSVNGNSWVSTTLTILFVWDNGDCIQDDTGTFSFCKPWLLIITSPPPSWSWKQSHTLQISVYFKHAYLTFYAPPCVFPCRIKTAPPSIFGGGGHCTTVTHNRNNIDSMSSHSIDNSLTHTHTHAHTHTHTIQQSSIADPQDLFCRRPMRPTFDRQNLITDGRLYFQYSFTIEFFHFWNRQICNKILP